MRAANMGDVRARRAQRNPDVEAIVDITGVAVTVDGGGYAGVW
jgi:hypothetical protein